MPRVRFRPLPEFSAARLLDRVAEAMQVAREPAKLKTFPAWTQRVMRILKEQFIPREFAAILTADHSAFVEGIAVALAALSHDLARGGAGGGQLARQLAARLALDPRTEEVAVQVGSGSFAVTEDLQRQIAQRLFAA